AQFAPFAALTGHGSAIAETARITDRIRELSDDQQIELSRRLTLAIERQSSVNITYFIPDSRKPGGKYADITGVVRKIDPVDRMVELADGNHLALDSIADLKGEIFDTNE
ncbi:MAG: YolD-like family protein, partial [Muribaculaceae bacterium]|nr:YolD-like family protein [Muribaculaceae bacterium]